MNDLEIARKVKLKNITEITDSLNINEEDVELYGKYKAKLNYENIIKENNSKLILVTAISPTPLGEGKTTVSISLADALHKLGKKTCLALREPSLGPVFGIKGGATGGGYAQVAPMEDINLHFTGDIHAITSANNLLSALIDNHIFQGNELDFKEVTWNRCLDLNDRQLRTIETGLSGENKMVSRTDHFDISVASEIMAILCLSTSLKDLKERLSNILIGINSKDEPIYVKDLGVEGSLTVLLKDALKPNIVQTLEGTPAIIHGGPFANIAHGCNSILATKTAMSLSEYTVTEAGFGADLGCEKFIDIKCRLNNLNPTAIVLVATLKALKYHGGVAKENILESNLKALEKGMTNLYKHINNITNIFNKEVIVALNKHETDNDLEIEYLINNLKENNIKVSLVEGYSKGSEGSLDLANKIIDIESNKSLKYAYGLSNSIESKIKEVCTKIYGAKDIVLTDKAINSINFINKLNKSNLPICIAKTQFSFSDNSKNLDINNEFNVTIKDVKLKSGAGFIVVYAGNIMTMPGLPPIPAANNIDIDNNNQIIGLF